MRPPGSLPYFASSSLALFSVADPGLKLPIIALDPVRRQPGQPPSSASVTCGSPDAAARGPGRCPRGYYSSRIDTDRKTRNHVCQLEALGFTVTLAQAA